MTDPHSIEGAVSLEALNKLVGRLVTTDLTQNIWITAELSDVAVRGGHCYLELLQKDASTGRQIAKARGIIWANLYPSIAGNFLAATGQQFASGIKVMLRVSVTFHAVFGMSLVISAVNPDYTLGDLMRRRREILARLQAEGILNDNRSLQWPDVPSRLAVISAPGAAGYGDFINQLFHNRYCLRFNVRLFPAIMQGEKAPASITSALEQIMEDVDDWDGVVIIRGGGATSDLAAFEDYDLAASIAQFPLPVIIGIGHERDVTVLDYVANMRVKTPTAAAEWLISLGEAALGHLQVMAADIARTVTERISGHLQQIAYFEGLLPRLPETALERARQRLQLAASQIAGLAGSCILPQKMRLESFIPVITQACGARLSRERERLTDRDRLLHVLSPRATLARGYSLTLVDGKAVRSLADAPAGAVVTTILETGTLSSRVIETSESPFFD
ncbi:MAG: exodeoxyribonuclease VII large subunit [Candidatus Amulumruptor caecigallinarius]|nr:exodeoxyribonuclease VII large subunit [Candidatus Amulumruptor caecigallinarius]MCM1396171.1 exodeoxyribonuclease VII large subunit [Candidatus Amulumruptor caecigallinarius]MCM1453829.1 exodeoxyribonuclease VII large subunit [bacterium]